MMMKFIDKITPSIIRVFNQHLLKHAPLGWQLQLPTITWVWILVTVITLPIPFLIHIDNSGDDDTLAIILISVLTAVLEGFLFVYILIQFNNTKSFGKQVILNGFKEQFGYLYVFMLCMLHIIFYPLIIDIRKGNLMTPQEIKQEAIIFNTASFYFMGEPSDYRYFPTEKSYLKYKYYDVNENENVRNRKEVYYIEQLKPLMRNYFTEDSIDIDRKWNRMSRDAPKLYLIQSNTLSESYQPMSYSYSYEIFDDYKVDDLTSTDMYYYDRYQLAHKSDQERLQDIRNLYKLYFKYYERDDVAHFDSAEVILNKYKSNRFIPVLYDLSYTGDDDYAIVDVNGNKEVGIRYRNLNAYSISNVHSTISDAQFNKLKKVIIRLGITFYVALCLAILLFMFKNVRLRDFILMFVYAGLLTLVTTIFTAIFFRDEDLAIHVVIAVFLAGIYFSFFNSNPKQFSSVKTTLILLSNAAFAFAPIFFYMYFHEYLDVGKLPDEYDCSIHTTICATHYNLLESIMYTCLWGGVAFYIFVGSILYKKVYERNWSLPFGK